MRFFNPVPPEEPATCALVHVQLNFWRWLRHFATAHADVGGFFFFWKWVTCDGVRQQFNLLSPLIADPFP